MPRKEDKFVREIRLHLRGLALIHKIHGDEYHIGIPDLAITGKYFLWLEAKVGDGDPWPRARDTQKGFFKKLVMVKGPGIIASFSSGQVFVSAGIEGRYAKQPINEFLNEVVLALFKGFHETSWVDLRR